jgi:hypothetical protein
MLPLEVKPGGFSEHLPFRSLILITCGLALGGTGCVSEGSGDSGSPPLGRAAPSQLTIRWTIDEGSDPNVCAMGIGSDIDVS